MARIRYINPEFFTDDRLAELPPLYRIFFAGMWCYADREGRLDDKPKQLKVKILPYDNVDIDIVLKSLEDTRLINRYQVDNCKYIQIINFLKYQRPHHTEKPSSIPSYNGEKTVKHPSRDGEKLVGMGMVNGDGDGERLMGMGNGKTPLPPFEKGAVEKVKKPVSEKPDSGFETFWQAYPKKTGKGAAQKSFLRIKPNEKLLEMMIAAIASARESEQWKKEGGQFIPFPATWLNQGRWGDEHDPKKTGSDFSRRVDESIKRANEIYKGVKNVE